MSTPDPLPRRSPSARVRRRQDATRQRLVAAASELVAADGVAALRLRAVAEAADVGFGSFYSYFGSKEELVDAVAAQAISILTESTIELLETIEDPAQAVSVAHRWFVHQAVDDAQLAWLIVHLDHSGAFLERAVDPFTRQLFVRGMAAGRFRELDIDVAINHGVSTTIGAMRAVLERHAPPASGQSSAELVLRALGVPFEEARALSRAALPAMTSRSPWRTAR
jgi:AcrR family transcriptional regulator